MALVSEEVDRLEIVRLASVLRLCPSTLAKVWLFHHHSALRVGSLQTDDAASPTTGSMHAISCGIFYFEVY